MAVPPIPGPLEHNIRRRPVQGGISGGRAGRSSSGTLGMVLYDTSSWPYVIHNAHGDTVWDQGAIGASYMQPPESGGGVLELDTIATIAATSPPPTSVDTDGLWAGISDFTLSRFLNPNDASRDILGLGTPSGQWRHPSTLQVGERVWKSGRRTGVTTGTIVGLNETVDSADDIHIKYRGLSLRFKGVITVRGDPGVWLVHGGDSGSVYFDSSMNLVGVTLGAGILLGEDRTNPDNVINAMQPATWLQRFLNESGFVFPQLVDIPPIDPPIVPPGTRRSSTPIIVAGLALGALAVAFGLQKSKGR